MTLVNLNTYSGMPWMNLFKQSSSLGLQTTDTLVPQKLNADGYPTTTLANDLFAQYIFPSAYSGQRMVLAWSGQGSLSAAFAITNLVSGGTGVSYSTAYNTTFSGTDIRVVFDVNFSGAGADLAYIQLTFPAGSTYNNMRGAYFCRLSDEADVLAGKLTTPEFRAARLALGSNVLRTMDFQATNNTQQTKFSDDWSLGAFTWGYTDYRPGSFVGTTTGTNSYVCSAPAGFPATPTDGAVVTGLIGTASTSTTGVTLKVGSWSAIPVTSVYGGSALTGNLPTGPFFAVYDATLAKWRASSGYLPNGVPLKALVQMANECNANLYYCFSAYILDAEVALITQYVRDNLNSNLTWYCELGNELWNFGQFVPGHVYQERSNVLGFPDQYNSYHGYRFRQVMALVASNWAPRSLSTLKRNLATQLADLTVNGATESYIYEGNGLTSGYNAAPNRPIDFADCIGGAPYWGTTTIASYTGIYAQTSRTPLLIAAADDYASGTPLRMQKALDFFDADARMTTSLGAITLGDMLVNVIPVWRTRCAKYSKIHINYEGGSQFGYPNAADCTTLGVDSSYVAKITNLINAYKASQLFNQACFDYWTALGTGFPAGTIPGTYYWTGNGDQWALCPGSTNTTPWKSNAALVDFNAGKVRIKAQAA